MRKTFGRPWIVAPAFLALGAFGCAADSGISDELRTVHGIWRWEHSIGGIAGVRMDPGTEGHDLVFHFRRDGSLHIYSRGAHLATPRVAIDGAEPTDGHATAILRYSDPFPVFSFDLGIRSHRAVRTAPDTLLLVDPCCGRYRHTLVRVS